MDKFDLVFVKHDGNEKTFMFEAPNHSRIKAGDKVIVDTKNGKAIGTVVLVEDIYMDISSDVEKLKNYMLVLGATEPLRRVRAVIKQTDIEYDDEFEDEEEESE